MDLYNITESLSPQTKIGSAIGLKGGRLVHPGIQSVVLLHNGACEIEFDCWISGTVADPPPLTTELAEAVVEKQLTNVEADMAAQQ